MNITAPAKKLNSILVIDDDEPTNFLNQMIIEESGCARHVKALQSGQDALDYLTDQSGENEHNLPPDIIFLDINMPRMNGWEFLEQYQHLSVERRSKVMVVMLTTSLFPEDRQLAEDMPAISCFENKPLTPEKLERIVQTYFQQSAAMQESSEAAAIACKS